MSPKAGVRSYVYFVGCLLAAALSSCASVEPPSGGDPASSPDATPTESPNAGGVPSSSTTSGGETETLLLAQQIDAFGAGNGDGPDCRRGPGGPDPAVFLSNSQAGPIPGELVYMRHTGLCLSGFDPQGPVVLNVRAGETAWTTQVVLDSEAAEYNQDESGRETLFDGKPITAVALADSEYFQSPTWVLVPPNDVRDALTSAGEVTVDAEQGELRASARHQVQPETEPNQVWIDPPYELAVYGFEPATVVPIGLYQGDTPGSTTMTLIDQIGTVAMPASRVAVFEVPPELVEPYAGEYTHCVAAPIGETVYNCGF